MDVVPRCSLHATLELRDCGVRSHYPVVQYKVQYIIPMLARTDGNSSTSSRAVTRVGATLCASMTRCHPSLHGCVHLPNRQRMYAFPEMPSDVHVPKHIRTTSITTYLMVYHDNIAELHHLLDDLVHSVIIHAIRWRPKDELKADYVPNTT